MRERERERECVCVCVGGRVSEGDREGVSGWERSDYSQSTIKIPLTSYTSLHTRDHLCLTIHMFYEH